MRVSVGLALSWIPVVLLTVIGPVLSERWALSRRQPAGRHPNVLLIILDTVRAQNLGLYGYRYSTAPELERWARKGVVFDFAVAPSSWTLPSHAAIFTGRSHRELNVDWFTGLDDRWPTARGTVSGPRLPDWGIRCELGLHHRSSQALTAGSTTMTTCNGPGGRVCFIPCPGN
jgi:hypothetical protein